MTHDLTHDKIWSFMAYFVLECTMIGVDMFLEQNLIIEIKQFYLYFLGDYKEWLCGLSVRHIFLINIFITIT